jgi:hypothetical protein
MNPQPSKQFRWIGQPSEEELLGIPVSPRHRRRAVERAAQAPPARRVVIAALPARRLGARDFLTVLGTVMIIWLVLGGAGAGFQSSGATPVAPRATDPAPELIHLDRAELGTLPRAAPSPQDAEIPSRPGGRARDRGFNADQKDDPGPPVGSGGSGSGGVDKLAETPLVEATLPVVGTVTVEEPELPLLEAPELPPLPELPALPDLTLP